MIPLWRGQVKRSFYLSFLLLATTSTYLIFMVGSITGRPVGNSSKKFAMQFVIPRSIWKSLSHFLNAHIQVKISANIQVIPFSSEDILAVAGFLK